MILCDTDIFIEALKNDPNAIDALRRIGFKNIALSSITVMDNVKDFKFIEIIELYNPNK